MNDWLSALQSIADPMLLVTVAFGVFVGTIVGAIPGLSATIGVVVFLPVTFALDPLPGVLLLLGIYGSALYAGSVPAILLRTPGTPSAAATIFDGYPLAQSGKAGLALQTALVASVAGGLLSAIALAGLAPAFATVALNFGPPEYFMIAVFALTIIASLGGASLVKGLISGVIGIGIGLVGMDPIQGFSRYTFGNVEATAGVDFLIVMIGLFGVGEAFTYYSRKADEAKGRRQFSLGSFKMPGRVLKKITRPVLGSSVIGFFVGLLPGTGGDIGAFVGYNETVRFSKDKSKFGKGDVRGLAAAESANNASTGGALVPMLTLGIPGDAPTAVLIGALTVHGLRPGPLLFENEPDLVYAIFIGFLLTYVFLLIIGNILIRGWAQVLRVPLDLMWPLIIVLCVLGTYAIRSSLFDLVILGVSGLLGFMMIRYGFPLAPLVIGVILGPIAESGFRRAVILSGGNVSWLMDPIPLVLGLLTVASLVSSVMRSRKQARQV